MTSRTDAAARWKLIQDAEASGWHMLGGKIPEYLTWCPECMKRLLDKRGRA